MTQEEKAKAYDEALERGKIWQEHLYEVGDKDYADELNYIFPQLRESEDEKIRKMLIDSFTRADMGGEIYGKGVTYKQVIAWLEKQGTSYTKRDVDDAYVEGMAFAKNELEKQKPTWSEEDEVRLQACIDTLQAKSIMGKVDTIQTNWLKSLKQRYTWKPNKEQMHYLNWLANVKLGDSVVEQEVSKHLNELYNDLTKL